MRTITVINRDVAAVKSQLATIMESRETDPATVAAKKAVRAAEEAWWNLTRQERNRLSERRTALQKELSDAKAAAAVASQTAPPSPELTEWFETKIRRGVQGCHAWELIWRTPDEQYAVVKEPGGRGYSTEYQLYHVPSAGRWREGNVKRYEGGRWNKARMAECIKAADDDRMRRLEQKILSDDGK